MTLWLFCSCLGPALAASCFAAEAASSPPNPLRPSRLALSQKAVIESAGPVLKIREDTKAAQFRDDLLARAAVFSQSSSTVVGRNTTNVNSSVASPSLPHKPSSQSGSGRVFISLQSTVMHFGATNGSSSISSSSTTFLTTSSGTAVEVNHDNIIASALSKMKSTTPSVSSHNSTGLTSSPVSMTGAAGANVDRSTTLTSSSRSASTDEVFSSDTIRTSATTSINSTNSAALADGIALGGALLLFSKSAAAVGSDIVKIPTKTTFLESLETIESNLEKAFKDRGGVDTEEICVAKVKRFRFRKRDLLSLILNDFRCAIDSVDTFESNLKLDNPDPTVLADNLEAIKTWAKKLEADEENDDDEKTTTSEPTSQRTATATSNPASQLTRTTMGNPTSQRTTTTTSNPTSWQTTTATSNIISQRITSTSRKPSSLSRSSASRTATISSDQLSNATCYTGSMYPFPVSPTAHDAADSQSVVFSLIDFALSSFFAMDPPASLTTASLNPTWATKSSMTMASLPSSTIKSASMTKASLSSSTIKPASIHDAIAIPVPGQNGIAQCVYEIVSEQPGFPPGTENGCFCAGGSNVSAAWAPLLTHSPTSSGTSSVTDCAYTTQPTPGWTPSITATSTSTTALEHTRRSSLITTSPPSSTSTTTLEHTTRSSLITKSPLPELACIQLIYELQAGKNPKQINTCTCNDGSKPTATLSDRTFVCPSQVTVILAG